MSKAVLILGRSGTGKGQPKTDVIPTPNGDMVFGDLSVGDTVFGSQGQPVTVVAIHDRGIIPTYEVTFSDGAKKVVDGEHIWTLERDREGKKQIRDVVTKDLEGKRLESYYLPMTAIEYDEKHFHIDPYLLGLWLADGSVHGSSVRITKKDPAIVEYLKTQTDNFTEHDGIYQFNFLSDNHNLNRQLLNKYGFDNSTKSKKKAIPTDYLLGSLTQRKELLRGLMDGDGSYPHSDRKSPRAVLYSTTSHSLAMTVHRLVTSLGYVARDRHVVDKREGKTDYFQVSFNPGTKYDKRSIVSVVRVQDQDIQCIEVDDPRHLYVCDTYNHLLTHNSTSMRNFKDEDLAIVNVVGKELPFQTQFTSVINTSDYETIKQKILGTQKKSIVIDDAGYLITKQFMDNHNKVGGGNAVFQLYNDMADQFWMLIDFIKNKLPADKIVYIVMHEDYDERGGVKPKTIGKLLDEKVCIEGLFTIVLRSCINDGKYQFCTRNSGGDAVKSPMGLFEQEYIDNDLAAVDKVIRAYYGIGKEKKENEK